MKLFSVQYSLAMMQSWGTSDFTAVETAPATNVIVLFFEPLVHGVYGYKCRQPIKKHQSYNGKLFYSAWLPRPAYDTLVSQRSYGGMAYDFRVVAHI